MTNQYLNRTLLLSLGALTLAAGTAGPGISNAERDQALRYLAATRIGLIDSTKGLSEAQWKFKPAPDRWSIAEVVEHLALIEEMITGNILAHLDKAPSDIARDLKKADAEVMAKVPDRTTKFQAPEPAVPTGRWAPDVALQHFLTARTQTAEVGKTSPYLRGHIVKHPVFGPLDGYQWILAVAAHTERHTMQIFEVKADPKFPSGAAQTDAGQ